jgi:hypothetical protein
MGVQNLLGQTFNRLTVIDGPIIKNKKTYWVCKCACGNIKEVRADQLKSGTTKSCGCYKNDIFIENNKLRQTLNLTNKRFGKLTAIEKTDQRKEGRVVWKCQCDCGNIIYVDTHSLQEGKVNSCGCLVSKGENKISQLLKENNINFTTQKYFQDCKFLDTGYYAKFDFWVNNKYLIEYDGEQHFYYKDSLHTWNNKENYNKVISHDQYKNQWCKEHDIPLIRIPYTHLEKLTINDLLLETSFFRII